MRKKSGFSLLEMLIYIAILVLMLGIIFSVVVSISQSNRKIVSARNIENAAVTAIERISRELRLAVSVDTSNSILGTDPGKLVLTGLDSSNNPRTVEFYLTGGRLYLKENSVEMGALTGASTTITHLIFYRFASSTAAEGIRAEMTVESGTSTYFRSEKFYSSATIR